MEIYFEDPLTSDTYKVTSDDTIHVENFTVSKSYNLNIQSGIEIKNMSVVSANDHMFLKSFTYDIMKDSMAKMVICSMEFRQMNPD